MQQLDIDGPEHIFSRIALILLLEFVISHDKTVIQKLEKPEVMLNSDKYLMLANNCLEQLDIINNNSGGTAFTNSNSSSRTSTANTGRRMSLLDLLDNTKTPLGKNLLRQRLSIPITDSMTLNKRYALIGEFQQIHNKHAASLAGKSDKYGSPLHQLRQKLSGIRNIDNYLRKMITSKLSPTDIPNYYDSLNNIIHVYNYLNNIIEKQFAGTPNTLSAMLPPNESFKQFTTLVDKFKSDIIMDNLRGNLWSGIDNNPFRPTVNAVLDELQSEIDDDASFLDNLITTLSKFIDTGFNPETSKTIINKGDNVTKGIHIYVNKARRDALEQYFEKNKTVFKVGKYNILPKDINFTQMKDSGKWEIELHYLKTSNGTLKANLDRMGQIVKSHIIDWIQINITNNEQILDVLSKFSHFIAETDLLQSNTYNAVENGYISPAIDDNRQANSYMIAEKIRHPIIEQIATRANYVPNDVKMGIDGVNGMLLFGVNAVGKSSLMKSMGINIIMAQAGMFVAASSFVYKPYKYLFTRIRNNDNLYAGLSSFEVEMKEFKVILKYANEESIILGDELCSGTETQDATALVAAGIGQLSKRNSSFIFATHLHFLADMSYVRELQNVKLFHLLVERDPKDPSKLIYSRKLQEGNGPKSYGILVCESMNLDEEFIEKAKEIRASMDKKPVVGSLSGIIGEVSKYNKEKVVEMCEVCKESCAVDVHHINQQCDANENHNIEHQEYGIFNKNKLYNLVALCKECHQSVHSGPCRLKINGYSFTNKGVELSYNWLGLSGSLGFSGSITEEKQKQNQKGLKIKNEFTKEEETVLTEDIKDEIIKMSKENTVKKIQFDIKRKYNITVKQQQIRDLI
jgi:DNA mismatch repair protein MutS